ncbi:MAG: serine hydrolase [Pseudomonadales bacterium]|nr:serine hydrolase [Pseudomonadales bacterium]
MKKIKYFLIVLLSILLGLAAWAGITPAYITSAPAVAAGIGAKLLCSSHYVSGFSREQSFDDLVQYSPLLEYLSIDYNEQERAVSTSFFRMAPTTATYIPGLGCAVSYPGYEQRHNYEVTTPSVLASLWPHGNRVPAPDPSLQALLQDIVERDNRQGLNTRALLVVRDGQVSAEVYAQGAGPDTPLLGWSMAKSLVSIMIGNLQLREEVSIEDSQLFSPWQQDGRADIQLGHLLTMTDGLDFSERYNPGDDATAMLFTAPSVSDYAMARPLQQEPGTVFNYSSGTANLLSRYYFETVGGTLQASYEDYRQNILGPMGFQHSVFEVDASGVFVGSSYFYASARDWARLGQLMLNRGVLNGHRIVSAEWVEASMQPNGSGNNKAYGYQWWLNRGNQRLRWPDLPVDAFAAQGNRQQSVMVIPSENLVIVRLGWTAGGYPANSRFAEIVQQASL